MPHFILNPIVSARRCDHYDFQLYNHPQPILLSNQSPPGCIWDLILQLPQVPLDRCSIRITSVVLEVPIQDIKLNQCSFTNELTISINPNNSLNQIASDTETLITKRLDRSMIQNSWMTLDITPLLTKEILCTSSSIQLLLCIKHPGLTLQLCSLATVQTQINITYESIPTQPDTCISRAHSFLHIIATKSSCCCLSPNDLIKFDVIHTDESPCISYNTATNQIVFRQLGSYYMYWILNLLGSNDLPCICIGLKNANNNEEVYDFHAPCVLQGQICGHCIVTVTQIPSYYILVNDSKAMLQLSQIPIQASLTAFRI